MSWKIQVYKSDEKEPVWGAGELVWEHECPNLSGCKRWGRAWKYSTNPDRGVMLILAPSGACVFNARFAPPSRRKRLIWYWGSPDA